MAPNLFRRVSLLKLLGLGTVICICCALGLAIGLLNRGNPHSTDALMASVVEDKAKNNVETVYHPRNIFPAFIRKHQELQGKIKRFNETVNKLTSNKLSKAIMGDIHEKEDERLKSGLDVRKVGIQEMGVDGKRSQLQKVTETEQDLPSYNVHAFYYPWYGNPENDGKYIHWNHKYLQHWNKDEARKWKSGQHVPPHDIGSNYYPALGAYSSSDPDVIDKHMAMMRYAKIGVVVVSWYPPGDGDRPEIEPDRLMPLILDKAEKYKLKVAIHIEPYKNRNQHSMKDNLQYVLHQYGSHPALYRTDHRDKKNLPLFYIYDSYLVKSQDWAEILKANGKLSVRNTDLDGIFIGLLVEQIHKTELLNAGFDGFYTYFGTNGFTYGSTWKVWPDLSKFAKSYSLLFIPSVGPGYIDTEVRPWNGKNTRKRLDGKYYNESFDSAMKAGPRILSITSFNEWHEGTQIEPAVKKEVVGRSYLDYGTHGEMFYLNLTRLWVQKFS